MAMRAVLRCHCPLAGHFVTCKVLVTSPKHVKSVGDSSEGKEDGICRVKPGKEIQVICDFSREKFVTRSILSAIGFPPNGFQHTAMGSPNILLTKESTTSTANRNEEMVCKSQYMFFDWAPAKTVYEWGLRPYKRSCSSGNVSKEKCVWEHHGLRVDAGQLRGCDAHKQWSKIGCNMNSTRDS